MTRKIFCFLGIFSIVLIKNVISKTTPQIGIIGGGIGGTSCAYFLNKLFNKKASIVLFERDTIGGRLNLINVDGKYYDSGGAVIHQTNKYMSDFAKLLDLSRRSSKRKSQFGIYDGYQFVFEESNWSIVTIARLLYRYGFSIYRLDQITKSMLHDFSRIYDAQDAGLAFTMVSGLLDYMNPKFRNMTQESLLSRLKREEIPDRLLSELVQSVMMVNYGQTNNISSFAGFVSLAGADPGLWSVKGGNKMVPQKLLQVSTATVVSGDVQEVTLHEDGTYKLLYRETYGELKNQSFDIVVMAAPLIRGSRNIAFKNFKKNFNVFESVYHRTVATFVHGNLKPSAFNADSVPDEILTFNNKLLYNSLGRVWPVDETEGKNVYKIFSQKPLISDEIDSLFSDVEQVKIADWLAYPHYKAPEHLHSFMMHPGLYYINAIEASASAMETSAIASRNVALLAFHLWNNAIDMVDSDQRTYREEL